MMTMVAPTGKFGCLLSSTSATLLPIIVNGGFILRVVALVMLVMVDVGCDVIGGDVGIVIGLS